MNYLYLVLTALIWGFAFVAQRKGMEYLDPLVFNALRFVLGALSVGLLRRRFRQNTDPPHTKTNNPAKLKAGLALGILLFVASTFQQVGIVFTSAGSAGFITGLYVVFVPLIGLFRGQKLRWTILVTVLLAAGGLWLINRPAAMQATLGNFLVLVSAVFFAFHVQLIDKLATRHPSLDLAFIQYWVVALASLAGALVWYPLWMPGLLFSVSMFKAVGAALLPILYGGVMSVGIAYTLQLHAQKRVPPHPASLVLCLEAVFALAGGAILLGEPLPASILAGAALLLSAMLISILTSAASLRSRSNPD
jgi:drug/metabolite transporter (DMT)-like permease